MLKETIYKYCRKDSLNVSEKATTSCLQDSEIQQMQSLPNARKEDFLYGRFLLKKTLKQLLHASVVDFAIVYIDSKPAVVHNGVTYCCSLTHSKQYVGCAVSTTSWPGIDVEEMKVRSDDFLRYVVDIEEQETFSTIFNNSHLATIIWNIKEATFKADPKQGKISDYIINSYNDGMAQVFNKVTKKHFIVRHQICENTTRALVV